MTSSPRKQRRPASGSFPRYLLVGVFTSLLDFSLFTGLSVPLGLNPVPSNIISTVVTICVSYLINQRWVFRSRASTWGTFFSFASVSLVTGMLIQTGVIWGLVHIGHIVLPAAGAARINPAAKIIAMGVGAMCNYLGYRFVFRKGDQIAARRAVDPE